MDGKALCYFQHKGVDYKKGATVSLPEADIKALEKIGLVGGVTAEPVKAAAEEPAHKKKAKS